MCLRVNKLMAYKPFELKMFLEKLYVLQNFYNRLLLSKGIFIYMSAYTIPSLDICYKVFHLYDIGKSK